LTSHDKKKIIDIKKINPFQDGRLSSALYMMNTQPSWDAATYTVKKLVATTDKNSISYQTTTRPGTQLQEIPDHSINITQSIQNVIYSMHVVSQGCGPSLGGRLARWV